MILNKIKFIVNIKEKKIIKELKLKNIILILFNLNYILMNLKVIKLNLILFVFMDLVIK